MARSMATALSRARADEAFRIALGEIPNPGVAYDPNPALFPTEALADDGGRPAGHRGLRRLAARHRLLLAVVLDEVAGRAAELEHRHLALAAVAEAEGDHRRADPRADVDGAGRLVVGAGVLARAVEPVHVAVAGDHADRQLVQPRQRHLPAVRVAREDQRDAVAPQPVRLLGDVRERDRRQVAAQPLDRLVAARVAGVRVVEADHLQALAAQGDGGVPVAQHLGAAPLERAGGPRRRRTSSRGCRARR